MEKKELPLRPGLYVVATPIGNLKDITLRALEVLNAVDSIACEDTRVSGKLLGHYGMKKKFLNYHEHNGEAMRPFILEKIKAGQRIALISDAGTPLISDPGYKLVRAAQEENLYVTTLPGASSVISALTLSGLPTDHFLFCGFINKKTLATYAPIPYTLVFLASPHKVMGELALMQKIFAGREVSLVREISKLFEEVKRGSFAEVMTYFETHTLKGEIVLVVGPVDEDEVMDALTLEKALNEDIKRLKNTMPTKELATLLSGKYGLSKKDVYGKITDFAK